MIPNTLLGLLAFGASIGPGYVFVRVAETRGPRPERSQLLELAELVVVGSAASAAAFLVGFVVADETGWVDLETLAESPVDYLHTDVARGLSFPAAVLAASYAGSWGLARLIYRGRPEVFRPHPLWHEFLWDDSGAKRVFATVELHDGRKIAGYVAAYTSQDAPPAEKELVLQRPIAAVVPPHMAVMRLDDDRILVPGSEIALLSIKYELVTSTPRTRTRSKDGAEPTPADGPPSKAAIG